MTDYTVLLGYLPTTLQVMDGGGKLYQEFVAAATAYRKAVIELAAARTRADQQETQYRTDVEGRLEDLQRRVGVINERLTGEQKLPNDQRELSDLAAQLVNELYEGRRK